MVERHAKRIIDETTAESVNHEQWLVGFYSQLLDGPERFPMVLRSYISEEQARAAFGSPQIRTVDFGYLYPVALAHQGELKGQKE